MLPAETKHEFIRLRAEGHSYRAIQDKLGISKSTCQSWEKAFKREIAEIRADSMSALYQEYGMTKEARIKRLGSTLDRLQSELDRTDLSKLPPDKLLDYCLKYSDALRAEYAPPSPPIDFDTKTGSAAALVSLITDLINRIRAGELTGEQASRESAAIANLVKAYHTEELENKLAALEAVLETRY